MSSICSIQPYINFDGQAEQAIAFYEQVFGAKASMVNRFSEMPDQTFPEGGGQRIMHATLTLGESIIMLSDVPPGFPCPSSSNVHISVQWSNPDDMTAPFNALAGGGEVGMDLQDAFWGARFGMVKDKFGVSWMFNCPQTA